MRVQKYLIFTIKSYYYVFLDPIYVLRTLVMVLRLIFLAQGTYGALNGP